MARFIFCSIPEPGHVFPALPVAQALVARGHSVRWYTGSAFASSVRRTGAEYRCMSAAAEVTAAQLDAAYPERANMTGIRNIQHNIMHLFLDPVPAQVADLRKLIQEEPADVIVADNCFGGATTLHELGGPPFALYGTSVLQFPSRDVAPFGSALPPAPGPINRLRNPLLHRLVKATVLRPTSAHGNVRRRELGLPPVRTTVFDYALSPYLFLQLSSGAFEYPRSDLPPQVHFVGTPAPGARDDWRKPKWWHELNGNRPVVLVTQGTFTTDPKHLLRPALQGLADQDMLVIATTGGSDPAAVGAIPGNARVERFIPFGTLLPHVDVMVTNGGFGAVQLALGQGIPLLVAGDTEDKMEVGARVAWTGAGIRLRTHLPSAADVARAVHKLLLDLRYRREAERLRACSPADPAGRAAQLLEDLGRTRSPVVRLPSPRQSDQPSH